MTGAAYRLDGRQVERESFYAAACDPARAVVVEACAGAGKTWMLVSRILRALLDGAQPQQILAITFTRKAAGEMRARLDEWLVEFAAADHERRVLELRLRGLSADEAEAAAPRLGELQAGLLEAGRSVEIRTFHAWFSQLMRAAPMDLLESIGLAPGLELIEDEAELEPELFRRFHATVLADEAATEDYRALIASRGRASARKWLLAAWDKRVEIELADAAGTLESAVDDASCIAPEYAGLADPALRLRQPVPAGMLSGLASALGAQSKATPRKQAAALVDALQREDARATLAVARKALLNDKGAVRAHLEAPGLPEVVALLDEVQRAVEQRDAHLEHRRMVRLARLLLAEYAALKRQRGLADMADLERCALALLRDSLLAGWVQQRLDAKVRHLLIDEFQDTSPLQWHALHAWLSGYAGAGGGQGAPSVFIVGDPKQSIYRFRRAEPRVFAAARDFVSGVLGGSVLECDHTRRNAPGVLAAVNSVFNAAAQQGRYDGFRAHTTESTEPPGLSGVFALPTSPQSAAARSDEGGDKPSAWRHSLSQPRVELEEHRKQDEARCVAATISSLVASGMSPGDIHVLARQRAPLRRLAEELQASQLPHASSEPFLLRESPEVLDLVALLDVLASPTHDLSLAQVLKSPMVGADDAQLLALADAGGRCGWWTALMSGAVPALQQATDALSRWAEEAQRLPPHDLLDLVVHESDLHARVAARVPPARRAAALASIDSLLQLALELDGGRYPTAYGFVRALKRRALKAVAPGQADAVQLLTVHGAKGLEAPAVFIMDADAEKRNGETYAVLVDWPVEAHAPRCCAFVASEARLPASLQRLLEAEMAAREREELNGLYVAMTRAERLLFVSRTEPQRVAPNSWWPLLQQAVRPWTNVDASNLAAEARRPACLLELPEWGGAAGVATRRPAANDDVAARLGSALHRVLEWASGDASADLPLQQLARAAAQEWSLDEASAAVIVQRAAIILDSPECRPFFEPTAIEWAGNEVPLADGADLLRIDRLVARREEGRRIWWVLDYKMARAPQDEDVYLVQLRRYRDLVRRLQPGDSVRCAFINGEGALIEPML